MAKSRRETETPEGFTTEVPIAPPVPDGFEQVTAERVRHWLVKGEGVVLYGRLVGRFDGKNGPYYQVKLLASCGVAETVGEGENKKKVESIAVIDDVINVDGHKALEDTLRTLCDDGGKYEIYAIYGKQVAIQGGHTFWPVVVHKNVVKRPTRASKEDMIPF